ncbi:porin [Pelagicoccus sp. SDUM812003]|uniref:porin n=1 Tax=Pelagicoccus sp. SDUM812003 TaxID=3041267 RepID=UPI00280E2031|nr:porin [Pelagicoccus sp. SDUM812003]MDQ8204939.1 porin [Pelagicoccus sp. SDUM812003]
MSYRLILHPQFDSLESDLQNADTPEPDRYQRDFFRRLMLGAKFKLSERWGSYYVADFNDHQVKNHIARLEWSPSSADTLYFGYQKAPFGNEDTSSSTRLKAIERSANTRFWNEVIGLGSYHSGIFYTRAMYPDLKATLALTHNVKSESDWPDVGSGEVSLYGRLVKSGSFSDGSHFQLGLDLGYQAMENEREIAGVSLFGGALVKGYNLLFEATGGAIDLSSGEVANAFGWHAEASHSFLSDFEWVARLSSVDTDGAPLKLSSAIRKAPASGYAYERVDSLYLGINYLIDGDHLKLSVGYELGDGSSAISGPGSTESVEETVSGFRVRGQLSY